MPDKYILERIGRKLREVSGHAVEEQVPEHWRALIGRLAQLEQRGGRSRAQRERQ